MSLRLRMYRALRRRGWTRANAADYALRNPKSFRALREALEAVELRAAAESGIVREPWDDVFVAWLNAGQADDRTHSYTCPDGHELIAFVDGWSCSGCLYTQDWAHAPAIWRRP